LNWPLTEGNPYKDKHDMGDSNKLTNPMQQFLQVHYLIFCVAHHVSGASTHIIRSLQLHKQPLVLPWSMVVAVLLVVAWLVNQPDDD
jgi:hypothetical protein